MTPPVVPQPGPDFAKAREMVDQLQVAAYGIDIRDADMVDADHDAVIRTLDAAEAALLRAGKDHQRTLEANARLFELSLGQGATIAALEAETQGLRASQKGDSSGVGSGIRCLRHFVDTYTARDEYDSTEKFTLDMLAGVEHALAALRAETDRLRKDAEQFDFMQYILRKVVVASLKKHLLDGTDSYSRGYNQATYHSIEIVELEIRAIDAARAGVSPPTTEGNPDGN